MKEPKLKAQLKLVASYYVGECAGNAEQSAIRAGYSRAYARGNAYKLVARPDVQEYIKYLNSLTENDPKMHIATAVEIQGFWTETMNNEDEPMKNRLRASELLAKCKGMFLNDTW